ncbi:hypothetical protein D3C86_1736350 [compost metagenome]
MRRRIPIIHLEDVFAQIRLGQFTAGFQQDMVHFNFLGDHRFGFDDFFSFFLDDNIPDIAACFFFSFGKINMSALFLNVIR